MYDSKLIHLLKALNSEQKELLKKWVQSPAHNHRADRQKLFIYLLSKRKLSPFTCDRCKIYNLLYPNEEYNDAQLKRLMNLSVQLLEEFIHFLTQKEDSFSQQKSLINFAGRHRMDKYVQQYIQKMQTEQAEAQLVNSAHFYQQFELEQIIFEHQSTNTDRTNTNLQAIFDAKYLNFILDSLHYACEAITHQQLYKSSYKIPLLEPILADISDGKYKDIPSVQIYYYSYMALSYPEEEIYFETLHSLLFTHYRLIAHQELRSLYFTAINYCIKKLNIGKEKYVRSVFELYQYGLEHHILIENNVLSRFTYKNIVAAALRLNEYDWVVEFIKNYTHLMEEVYQKPYSLYAQAKLHFAQGDFDTTLGLLAQVDFDNLFLNMDAKTMLLKIYYERKYFDALDALLVSFKRFLQRKSIVAYQRNIHKNMVDLVEKLLAIQPHEKKELQNLRIEIENTTPLTEKPWLLAQLDKMN